MKVRVFDVLLLASVLATPVLSFAGDDVPLLNWTAPPYWTSPTASGSHAQELATSRSTGSGLQAVSMATPAAPVTPTPLPFVAVTPCRVADTRDSSYNVGAFLNGTPSLQVGVTRAFFVKGLCGIPQDAQAVSLNATVVNQSARGWLALFPGGTTWPGTSTLNFPASTASAIANAAIVPLSSCTSPCADLDALSYSSLDLIIDVNGYYSPLGIVNSVTPGTGLTGGGTGNVTLGIASAGVTSTELATNAVTQPKLAANAVTAGAIASGQVVKSLNGLADSLTIAGAGGASVSQLGQTITVTAPAGLPSGSASQTLRNTGAGWAASSALTNDGTNVGISGNLNLPVTTATTGQIRLGAYSFAHIFGTNNTFVGAAAGNLTLTGGQNTGIGDLALANNTSGASNTAVGQTALFANKSGSGGTAVGREALFNNTAGAFNTSLGYASLYYNTTANNNTAVGVGALYTQAYANGGTPWDADNTAIGYEALNKNAPLAAANGIKNTAVGSGAMRQNTTGLNNTAIGYQSLYANTLADKNVALGFEALQNNTTAGRNTAAGAYALYTQSFSNSSAKWDSENTAVGYEALYFNQPTATTNGRQNTAVGAYALRANTTGTDNTALGTGALIRVSTGSHNVAVGGGADFSSTASENTSVGSEALHVNSTGAGNTALGRQALDRNDTGSQNVSLGLRSLFFNASGSSNVAVGAGASYNQTGNGNTAVGMEALHAAGGSGNVGLGYRAGYNETGSNRLHIANTDYKTLIYGQFDTDRVAINATDPTTTLDVNGLIRMRMIQGNPLNYVCYDGNGVLGYCASDASLKEDVRPLTADHDVMHELASLRGVTFLWKDGKGTGEKRDIGVLAQDIEPVLPEVVSAHPDGLKSVDYPKLTAFLIEVAKAQQKEIDEIRARLAALEGPEVRQK